MTCNLPSRCNFKITFGKWTNFKITSEHILLVGDSNKFLLKKSVNQTHCNRLENHWTLKIYQILKPLPVSLTMKDFPETLRYKICREWRRWRQKCMVIGDCFFKLWLLAGLPKILTHTLLIHLKETPKCFSFRGKKRIKNQQWNT